MVVSLDSSFLKYVVVIIEEFIPILVLVFISEMTKRCGRLALTKLFQCFYIL